MKWGFAICVLVCLTACSKKGPTPHEVFEDFQERAMSDGTSVDALVSEGSLTHVKSIMGWVFRGEEEGIENLSLFDQYLVLSIRMEFDDLGAEGWRSWFQTYGESEGPVIDERLEVLWRPFLINRKLGEVGYFKGVMGGRLTLKGHSMDHRVSFEDEEGWKVDLISLWKSDYEMLVKPYLSDEYRNLNPVVAMLKGEFGGRYHRGLYSSRLKLGKGQ